MRGERRVIVARGSLRTPIDTTGRGLRSRTGYKESSGIVTNGRGLARHVAIRLLIHAEHGEEKVRPVREPSVRPGWRSVPRRGRGFHSAFEFEGVVYADDEIDALAVAFPQNRPRNQLCLRYRIDAEGMQPVERDEVVEAWPGAPTTPPRR